MIRAGSSSVQMSMSVARSVSASGQIHPSIILEFPTSSINTPDGKCLCRKKPSRTIQPISLPNMARFILKSIRTSTDKPVSVEVRTSNCGISFEKCGMERSVGDRNALNQSEEMRGLCAERDSIVPASQRETPRVRSCSPNAVPRHENDGKENRRKRLILADGMRTPDAVASAEKIQVASAGSKK